MICSICARPSRSLVSVVASLASGRPSVTGRRPSPSSKSPSCSTPPARWAPLIEGAKRKIWSIATTIVDDNPGAEIRMGLVAYRDIGDEYVTKTLRAHHRHPGPLRQSAGAARARRRRLAGKRQRGAACRRSPSSPGRRAPEVCRIVFLVGDAPPHMDYAQDVKYPEVMRIGARARHRRQRRAGRRRARHRAGLARDRADGQRPLHPDPAGRRQDRGDRDARSTSRSSNCRAASTAP